jgi:hypothetical protein
MLWFNYYALAQYLALLWFYAFVCARACICVCVCVTHRYKAGTFSSLLIFEDKPNFNRINLTSVSFKQSTVDG